jgi:O-antigen ligase
MRDLLRKLPIALIALLAFVTVLISIQMDIYVAATITVLIIVGFVIPYLKYDALIASILFLFIVFPLNITYVIPQFVENAYVTGTYVNYLAPTISILDLAALILLLSLTTDLTKERFGKWVRSVLLFGFAYFIIHNILFLDVNVFVNSGRLLLYLLVAILFYVERENVLKNLGERKNILVTVLAGVLFFQLLLAIGQINQGTALGLTFLGESSVSAGDVYASSFDLGGRLLLRGYGTFPHPNLLSGFASFVLVVSTALYLYFKKIDLRQMLMLFVPATLLLLLSFSHTGFLVLGAVILIYLGYFGYKKFSKGKVPLAFMGLWEVFLPNDRSVSERVDLVKASFLYLKDYPITGVGSGNFVKNFYQYSPSSDAGLSLMQPVHNIFMLVLVEHGIIMGGLLNILIISYFIIRFVRSNSKLFILLLFSYLLIVGNLDHYFLTLPQGNILFVSTLLFASLSD